MSNAKHHLRLWIIPVAAVTLILAGLYFLFGQDLIQGFLGGPVKLVTQESITVQGPLQFDPPTIDPKTKDHLRKFPRVTMTPVQTITPDAALAWVEVGSKILEKSMAGIASVAGLILIFLNIKEKRRALAASIAQGIPPKPARRRKQK